MMYKDDLRYKKIDKILKTTFFKVGNSKIKRAFTSGEIEKILGNVRLTPKAGPLE